MTMESEYDQLLIREFHDAELFLIEERRTHNDSPIGSCLDVRDNVTGLVGVWYDDKWVDVTEMGDAERHFVRGLG